ncbi:Tripartite DNA replication factor [Mortierella alpina]|nr:Tripartite DNA replication factor [Mortierella alpina]
MTDSSNAVQDLVHGLSLLHVSADTHSTQDPQRSLDSEDSFLAACLGDDFGADLSFSSLEISSEDWDTIDQAERRALSEPLVESLSFTEERGPTPSLQHVPPLSLSPQKDVLASEPPDPSGAKVPPASTTPRSPRQSSAGTQHRFKFSPSVLAHHANTACEKMLHLKGSQLWQDAQRSKERLADAGSRKGPSAIAEATMKRGLDFESRLQDRIRDKIDCEAEGDTDSFFRIATSPIGTTLCQPVLSLDDSFYPASMKKAGIVFGRFLPDFVRILPGSLCPDGTRKRKLFIIDAKSSAEMKVSHQFQVTLYAIFLDHLIKVHDQGHLVEIDIHGGVWIPSYEEPRTFSLTFMRPIVETFIYSELPSILLKPPRSLVWHIDSPCHQCEFLATCENDAKEQMTLSVIPMLSKKSALSIKSLFKPASGQSEIEDLEDLVQNRSSLTDASRASLAKSLHMDESGYSPLLACYREQSLKVLPLQTVELPKKYQYRFLINILVDPMTMLPFAFGLDIFKDHQVHSSRSFADAVPYSQDVFARSLQQARLAVRIIDIIYERLVQVSENQSRPILSIFFYNRAMLNDLSALLLKVICSGSPEWTAATKSRALDLLVNMYEDPSFLTLSEAAKMSVKLPDLLQMTQGFKNSFLQHDRRLFSIETALHTLVVLPVVGSYSYKDVMTLLIDVEAPDIVDPQDRDDDGYNLDAIYSRWTAGYSEEQIKTTISKWAEQQNIILLTLISLVREKCGGSLDVLLAPQMSFKMRSHFNMQHNILSQFAFFLQWEAITQAESRRLKRITLTRDEAFRQQQAFQCRYLGRHIGPLPGAEPSTRAIRAPSDKPTSAFIGMFEVTSRLDAGVLKGEAYKQWILAPDNPTGLKARMNFLDIKSLLAFYTQGSPAVVNVAHYDPEFNIVYISGTFNNLTQDVGLTENEYYILERRETSPTLNNSMEKLVETNENGRLLMTLLEDPNKWGLQSPDGSDDIFAESLTNPSRSYDMTASQHQAFTKVVNNRLQVIWGPPGSGKTHFLALTILRFVDILRSLSHKGQGQGPHTIVLAAFTHAAINNLVARVVKLHDEVAPRAGSEHIIRPLVIYRLGDPSTIECKGARVVEAVNLAKLQRGTEGEESGQDIIRIVCGTVWGIRKAASLKTGVDYMRNVQMLMIDEGSQLLAADAIHAIECLDPKRGRLIVAGDHLQLGPVIAGEYPASEHAIDPTGSIMKNLMRKRDNTPVTLEWTDGESSMDIGPCTSQLQDNFRMNEQLGSFMKTIYGANYKVQTPNRTLPYSGVFRGLSLPPQIRQILDPTRSAVCIELQLEDTQSQEVTKVRTDARVGAAVEATFVAGIVECYLEMVGVSTVTSLFVAVPHHVQRLAALNKIQVPELEKKYPLAQIKVDTIEKMQGQEADMVVACFALFDDEMVATELQYLYSVHRWIVTLSRARCKTVLLMTPQLRAPKIIGSAGRTRPSDHESLDGWGLLQAFERYADGLGGKAIARGAEAERAARTEHRPASPQRTVGGVRPFLDFQPPTSHSHRIDPTAMLAQPDAKNSSNECKKDENVFKHAWHSVEEALHLRSNPPVEDVPPPVPPKDEKWLVKTVNKSVPQGQEVDPSFWDKLFHKRHSSSAKGSVDDDDDNEAVSISVPADAALKSLGVQGDDEDLEAKKNYFKRMAARVKEKFDEDDDDSDSDSDDDNDKEHSKTEQQKLELKQRKKLAPKVDPKEMKEAHRALYGDSANVDPKEDDEKDKKMFGSWWGCHPRRSRAERKLAKQREAEAEQARVLAELEAKRKAEEEAAAAAAKAAERKWWQLRSPKTAEQKLKEKEAKERKSSSRKHQAIAAAAAYEAMKKYQAHQEKEGKKVSHGEMKAVLAGMAMAEAVKLFDSRHDDDDDDDDKDDTVAEAGSKALKLFELLKD